MIEKDRLYIDSDVRKYLEKIKLFFSESESKDIFFYAMALGINMPSKIEGKKDGFFTTNRLTKNDETLLYSLIIDKNCNLEDITNKNAIYTKAEECANTGFYLLKEMLESNSEEMLMKKSLSELEDLYDKVVE